MRQRKSLWAIAIGLAGASAVLTGCAQPGSPITGNKEDSRTQSETAATSSYAGWDILVVTYNDETGTEPTIQYSPGGRKVLHGATLMGWSYSLDHGQTWKYGGKVNPPKGWAALWAIRLSQNRMQHTAMFSCRIWPYRIAKCRLGESPGP